MKPPAAKLKLPEVTICAADSAFVDLTARAVRLSMDQVEFGDAILFSDVTCDGPFRTERIDPLRSTEQYSRFCLARLPDFIRTPFALVVQWDGYVTSAAAWKRAFLKYDYIGAAWHGLFTDGHIVGNGGFSLRSRRLMQAVQKMPAVGGFPEDKVISRVFRRTLERDYGMRFATPKVADCFSYEVNLPDRPTFGFHGVPHLARHMPEDELAGIVEMLPMDDVHPDKLMDLAVACQREGMTSAGRAAFRRVAERYSPIIIKRVMSERFGVVAGEAQLASLQAAYGTRD